MGLTVDEQVARYVLSAGNEKNAGTFITFEQAVLAAQGDIASNAVLEIFFYLVSAETVEIRTWKYDYKRNTWIETS